MPKVSEVDSVASNDRNLTNSWFSCEKLVPVVEKDPIDDQDIPDETEEEVIRARLVAFKPDKSFRKHLRRAINVTRWLYNKCVEVCDREGEVTGTRSEIIRKLRKLFTTSKSPELLLTEQEKELHFQVPSAVRDEIIREFAEKFCTQRKLVATTDKKYFKMQFRSKRYALSESITITQKSFSENKKGALCAFPRIWKGAHFSFFSEKLTKKDINHDTEIIRRKDGKFYIAVLTKVPVLELKEPDKIVALDPGVRIFQTTYDNDGISHIIGDNDAKKLDELRSIASKLREGIKRFTSNDGNKIYIQNDKYKKRLAIPAYRIERKIKNKVTDIHRKVAKFLCENYMVIIPEFESQKMAEKKGRKINGTATRRMLIWSHYKFRQLLIGKGQVTGTKIIVGTEEYTSMTCGNCFSVNKSLGSKKKWKCEVCEIEHHRDVNAARNILINNSHLI
jgi:IS605 OrfB family transposase